MLEGGFWLFTLPLGWIMNLGHRLNVVHHLYHDDPPYFRGYAPYGPTFVRGLRATAAIGAYLLPAGLCAAVAWRSQGDSYLFPVAATLAGLLFAGAVFALPGGMTYNAAFNDLSYLYRPDKALQRALEGGRLYLKAWAIGASAIALSFLGLAALGIGFFFTSVWAWEVVGYAFSRALVLSTRSKRRRRVAK